MKESVWLWEKSALVEIEVKKLKEEINKDFLDQKIRVIKQGVHDYGENFGDYCQEFISLMPQVGPNITIGISHDGMMYMVKCTTQTVKTTGRFVPGKVMDD